MKTCSILKLRKEHSALRQACYALLKACTIKRTYLRGISLFTHPENLNSIDSEYLHQNIKLLPVFFSITGAFSGFYIYSYKSNLIYDMKISNIGYYCYTFLNRKWFFDRVCNEFISQKVLTFGYHVSYKFIDRGIIQTYGPLGLSKLMLKNGTLIRNIQSGFIHHYLFFIIRPGKNSLFTQAYAIKQP
jgi:NADH:ubiquinone oxidoreductase subunit 5 (subunit L)/multisubunit Na+/H+ antiporter MnhA subunit